jgi:hypothetical protein
MSLTRTPEVLEQIELAIADNHGSIARAARQLATSPTYIRQWMQTDPEVASRLRTAQMIGHASLEDVAIERAVHGVEEDIFYQGEVVGQKTNYSDGLLQTLLKARITEYQADASTTAVQVNVNLMPRAESYEEWLVQREQALQLPAPQEAQFEELPNEREDTPVRLRDVL